MNYKQAAMRHYKDGLSLFEDRRFDNSDQLFGVATECALKSCLRNRCYQGLQLDAQFLNHINILWNKILIHIDPKAFPSVIPLLNSSTRPFDDWNVAQRYETTGFIAEEVCERHKKWSARIMGAAGLLGIRGDV
jgi:hypothetical protein